MSPTDCRLETLFILESWRSIIEILSLKVRTYGGGRTLELRALLNVCYKLSTLFIYFLVQLQ